MGVLWGSYGRKSDPDGGASLDAVWDKYYDSKEKYDKLVAIKRRVDPNHIFSSNAFGIDAASAPLIKGVDHCVVLNAVGAEKLCGARVLTSGSSDSRRPRTRF